MRGLGKLLEAGKRDSMSDQKIVQGMHDSAVSLGADCPGMSESERSLTNWVRSLSDDDALELATALAERSGVVESAELTGDLVPLVEKAVKSDGTAKIKLIQAGQGSSGYYPADVLKRDAGVFGVGTQVYMDHPSVSEESDRPERSVRDLAGSLTGPAVWEENGPDGPGLYAPVKFIDSVAPHINAIASISGMSIRASGKAGSREIDGKKLRTVESIDVAHSVDVVTRAGAGGRVLDLIESARSRQRGGTPPEVSTVDKETAEKLQTALTEAQAKITEQGTELARMREANLLREARAIVVETLATIQLPGPTRVRLTEQLAANPPVKDAALDRESLVKSITEAAKAEAEYLANVNGGNPVRGMGGAAPTDKDATAGLVESFVARGYSQEIAERMAAL